MPEKVSKVGLPQVLKAFWQGIRVQKFTFYYTLFAYFFANMVNLVAPLYYKKFFDTLTLSGDKVLLVPTLIGFLVVILLLHAVAWLLLRTGSFALTAFESKVMAKLKQISFTYLIDHSYSFFSNNFTGALVQRINRFSRAFERLYDTLLFSFIPLFVNVVWVIAVIWLQKRLIGVVILVWVLFVMAFSYLFSRWKLKYDIQSAAADSKTTGFLADTITNQNTVTSFTAEKYERSSFEVVSNEQARAQRVSWNLSNILDAVQAGFIVIVEFLIFYYAVKFWQRDAISVGTFVLIQVYILGLANRLWDFSKIVRNVYESLADSKEMVDILATVHEIQDVPGALALSPKEGEIRFQGVTFNFNETRKVLDDINLVIKGGDENSQQCGWLQDKFGFSWQVIPKALPELLNDPDKEKCGRVLQAMLKMKKIIVKDLELARDQS